MDKHLYTCQYCGKEYKPKRRYKQRFCSNSCRTRSFILKNKSVSKLYPKPVQKIEKMSWAGVGNAAAGTLAVNLLSNILISEENKPATKKDINQLISFIKQRYLPVYNLPIRNDGKKPYFDMQTSSIIYQ